ncbi:hypothetical protein IscW_ISCW006318 [Ixodes scapularis]|uniref:Uncharacterized protein n=1 Tax=Ixodes scapularis TaxID=6945 RepID=B7PQ09_IXOSC|nr:hypothetical protein IscW_ISCW006318 [Ixodes scapularis]|eukprot:XP_002435851.1 hypothetical protein IscW_ISCW006318 [Ixodes scapularis]
MFQIPHLWSKRSLRLTETEEPEEHESDVQHVWSRCGASSGFHSLYGNAPGRRTVSAEEAPRLRRRESKSPM